MAARHRHYKMTDRLKNKTIFITAAGQGIGRATAVAFAREGADVIATSLTPASLDSLSAEVPGIRVQQLDVRDADRINRLAADAGPVDVLFNCAGWVHHGTVLDCDEQAWAASFDINITPMYRTIRAFLPAMLAAGRGNIINMASVVSTITGAVNRCAYGATKGAVIGLTKSIARDFVSQGIRANAICPGTIESPSLRARMAAEGDYVRARAAFLARQPMGRMGAAEEVAQLAVYLASDESAFVTGQTFIVDGGWTM
jgi:2-keto-3-deoxy-L-fuconate dehydrogenase